MQQAYQALRVISEAQTIHCMLTPWPTELLLTELQAACAALQAGSDGIKAVILDFGGPEAGPHPPGVSPRLLPAVCQTVRAIPQPVLAIVRTSLAESACRLSAEADLILVAHEAEICWPARQEGKTAGEEELRLDGRAAVRLGYATWSAPAGDLDREAERILDMLRAKSALALRLAKAAVRTGQGSARPPQERLRQVNQFYLERVMATRDAREGLQAFLEKRQPRWQNR
ncbi:MAG TPA: enoyl-CoA hydratase-related protein [Ktedonobacteraceae bacterium]|jgi:enoyl-CoA hydratase/carnithine racemase